MRSKEGASRIRPPRVTLSAVPATLSASRAGIRRVGLITAHGWVGISTPVLMTARYLAQSGFQVDLFIDEDDQCQRIGIALPEFREANIRTLLFARRAPEPENSPDPAIHPFDWSFIQRARKLPGDYDWLVGFDPQGLVRAALLGETWGVPFIYHSLEIHDAEDGLKRLEREFSRRALLTVTQDDIRADILASLNGSARERVRVVPNSSLGGVLPEKRDYFRKKFRLSDETILVLAVGTLLPHHGIDRIMNAAPAWPPGFALILHGWIPDGAFEQAVRRQCAAYPERIFLSTEIISAENKSIVFQSADIGLVFYSPDDTNLTYAAGSAGKIFDFMQAGVPIVVNDLPGMRALIAGNGCGRVVPGPEDIGAVLPGLMQDYESLRAGALRSFGRYGFAASYEALLKSLDQGFNDDPQIVADPLRVAVASTSAGRGDEALEVIRGLRSFSTQSDAQLQSLHRLGRSVCQENRAGNFVVCGSAAGAVAVLLAWIVKQYSRTPRKVFFCQNPQRASAIGGVSVENPGTRSLEILRRACVDLKIADGIVILPGPLEQRLPELRNWLGMVALLHIGDGHEALRCLLENLCGQMVDGAILHVESDNDLQMCRRALNAFEDRQGFRFDIESTDANGFHFRYPQRFRISAAVSPRMAEEFQLDDPLECGIESQMSINERFQLYYAVRHLSATRPRLLRFIEIGSYAGASFYLICRALQRLKVAFQGIAVEPCGQPQFHEVMRRFPDNAVHLKCTSHDAARRLRKMLDNSNLPDFILVDGDHGYAGVRQDIIDFFPLLSPGGVMMFHDYLPSLDDRTREFVYAHHARTEPGIRRACLELLEKDYGLMPLDLPLLYPEDLSQTQAHLPIIPGVLSTMRAYRKTL